MLASYPHTQGFNLNQLLLPGYEDKSVLQSMEYLWMALFSHRDQKPEGGNEANSWTHEIDVTYTRVKL